MKFINNYLFLLAIIVLAACAGPDIPEEPTEVSPEMQTRMDSVRIKLKQVADLLPAEGEEQEITPQKGSLPEIGKFVNTLIVRLYTLEHPHLMSLATGAEDLEAVKDEGGAWLSSGDWDGLEAEPLKDHKMYTPLHGKLMDKYENFKYIGVTRVDYYHSGEIDGDEIVDKSACSAWFWVIDMINMEIVACTHVEAETPDLIYTTGSGSSALASNLRSTMEGNMNDLLNHWAGKTGKDRWKFIRGGDSDIGAEYMDF